MKKLSFLLSFLLAGNAIAETYVCDSTDYNPDNYEGQSLTLVLNHSFVTKVIKNSGSWFSDDGVIVNPKLISKTITTFKYEIDFEDDSYNGSLTIYLDNPIKKAVYAFSYQDDEGNRRITSKLKCDLKNDL